MIEFLGFFLVHWAVMIVIYKYHAVDMLGKFSGRFDNSFGRFLYNITECAFCLEHHVGLGVLFLYCIEIYLSGNSFSYWLILYPLWSATVMNIIYIFKCNNV